MALPVPIAFAVIVIQLALLVAVHEQVEAAVTATVPVAAAEEDKFDDVGEMPGVHPALNMNVSDRTLETVCTEPTPLTTAS